MSDSPPIDPATSAKPKGARLAGVSRALSVTSHLVTTVAGIVAIGGIWVWIEERADRDEERRVRVEEHVDRVADAEIRRLTLIGEAQAVIKEESSDGIFSAISNPRIQWAFDVLSAEKLPIDIRAERIDLSDLTIRCATVKTSSELLFLDDATVLNSSLQLDADEVNVYSSGVLNSTISIMSPAASSHDTNIYGSELRDVTVQHGIYYGSRTVGLDYYWVGPPPGEKPVDPVFGIASSRAKNLTVDLDGEVAKYDFFGSNTEFRVPKTMCDELQPCVVSREDAPPFVLMPDTQTRRPLEKALVAPMCVKPNGLG